MMKSVKLIDLIKNASNVYRTDYYIVVQRLIIRNHICLNNVVFSEDTFIKRTPERDIELNCTPCQGHFYLFVLGNVCLSTLQLTIPSNG